MMSAWRKGASKLEVLDKQSTGPAAKKAERSTFCWDEGPWGVRPSLRPGVGWGQVCIMGCPLPARHGLQ